MDTRENSPTPDDSRLTVSNEELERLLQNAESLVADIADGVGGSEAERRPKELHASPFPDKPDALDALEQTAAQVDRVEKQTGAAPASVEAQTTDAHEPPETESRDDSEAPAAVDEESEFTESPGESATADQMPDETEPDETETDDSAPASRRPESAKAPGEPGGEKPATPAPPANDADPTEASSSDGDDSATPPSEAPLSKGRKRLRAAFRAARTVALFPLTATIEILILIDKPFARLRPTTKLVLGLMGLVSLIMGIAAFFLPKLLASNPYTSIPPYSS